MTPDYAKQLILKHALVSRDAADLASNHGFLGSLKNESGLNENNFHEVMASIAELAPNFTETEDGHNPEIMAALWRIVTLGREWGLSPDSSVTVREAHMFEDWINKIAWAVTMFLDGEESEVAFRDYTSPGNLSDTEAELVPGESAEPGTDDSNEDETETAPRCMHLWSNGLFMNAGLPDGEEVIGDGDFWCSLTQTVLGPDGSYCDGDECRDSSRDCYEVS